MFGEKSADLYILGVTFDSKMIFKKHLHCFHSRFKKARYLEAVMTSISLLVAPVRCVPGFILLVLQSFSAVWVSAPQKRSTIAETNAHLISQQEASGRTPDAWKWHAHPKSAKQPLMSVNNHKSTHLGQVMFHFHLSSKQPFFRHEAFSSKIH